MDNRNWSAPIRLAREIAHGIIEQALPVGTRLGSLPDLATAHGVSVPTLHKAITYLLDDGILMSREGRGGGLVIASSPAQTAMAAMHLFFSGLTLTSAQIGEARDLIVVALAERACRMIGPADLLAIEAIRARSAQPGADAHTLIEAYDAAILAAARQPVLALVWTVLDTLAREKDDGQVADPCEQLLHRERATKALIGGNLADAIDLCRQLRVSASADVPQRISSVRKSDRIVGQIRATIETRGLRPGDEIGLERDLQALYAVGRATLRDALRTLERSGAIRMTPGRGGGIFVGAAQPYAAVEMTALYLSSISLSFAEQIESRQVLEARAVWLAAERMTPDIRAALQQAMAADAYAARNQLPDWAARGTQVERLIAHASGNPLLEFFTLALIEYSLVMSRNRAFVPTYDPPELARLVSLHHQGIVDAILDAEPERAAFKTRQYLNELGRWAQPTASGRSVSAA